MEIKPLSAETLEQAVSLANYIFPQEGPETAFRASLDKEKYKAFYEEHDIKTLEYWVGIENQQVVGTVGLFTVHEDHLEAAWVGYFCIHPEQRKKRQGVKLLEFAIEEAKKRGNTYLRLSTKTDNKEAHRLYQRRGFIDIDCEQEGTDITYYKQLFLKYATP